jgi:hypothetical protein
LRSTSSVETEITKVIDETLRYCGFARFHAGFNRQAVIDSPRTMEAEPNRIPASPP